MLMHIDANIEPMFYRLIFFRKSFHLDECNSEISFLSETPGTRRSTPLTSLTSTPQTAARTRTHSLRLERGREREVRTAAAAADTPGTAGELRKTLSLKQERDKAHIITLGNSKFETVPFGLSQDIPDVFL